MYHAFVCIWRNNHNNARSECAQFWRGSATYVVEAVPALAAVTEPAPAFVTRTGAIVQREPVSVTVKSGASNLWISKCRLKDDTLQRDPKDGGINVKRFREQSHTSPSAACKVRTSHAGNLAGSWIPSKSQSHAAHQHRKLHRAEHTARFVDGVSADKRSQYDCSGDFFHKRADLIR